MDESSDMEPMPHPTWLKAGATETEKVKEWAKGLDTRLGTVPLPAFEAAFKLSPLPFVFTAPLTVNVPVVVCENPPPDPNVTGRPNVFPVPFDVTEPNRSIESPLRL